MREVTLWSIVNIKTKTRKHHHIQDGWTSALIPRPISKEFTNQKAWTKLGENEVWQNQAGHLLENGHIVRIGEPLRR
ncbi:hypothetical protein [Priestia megaterium]|uniref:hypothetical protein n=1 Tax=Priestia megaterium TaxID=1404 RepID=UPI000BFDB98F|nr:hypothetical protein [Priestia megaterium]PGO60605.1 hypothetical protein CN981_08635 [Priestia megaterium]